MALKGMHFCLKFRYIAFYMYILFNHETKVIYCREIKDQRGSSSKSI